MKRIYTILIAVLLTASVFAQSPQKMSYQAVVRDASNILVTNQTVGMQISILQGSTSGTVVYTEIQTPTTNDNGLISIEFGGGIGFDTINWASDSYFIKTETDLTGGSTYTITGTSQLLSVPYAFYAEKSGVWSSKQDTIYTVKKVGIGTVSPEATLHTSAYSATGGVIPLKISRGSINQIDFSLSSVSSFIKSTNKQLKIGTSDAQAFSILTDLTTRLFINASGEVGIGTTTPERNLHINNVMRLEPRATAPSIPAEGDIYMDSSSHKLMVYDGTVWQACW